jgi:4-amino-4-deoxy-L-arabinose transferase-like glycosyltransferase
VPPSAKGVNFPKSSSGFRVQWGDLPAECYIREVPGPDGNSLHAPLPFWRMVGAHRRFFLLVTLAAFALRLIFYFKFPHVTGDSLIYGDIARNWLDYGTFGLTHTDGVHPTLIRLPGYPAFLAACFVLFGREHYHAVLLLQIVIDVVSCFFIADLARRTVSDRAARFAFLLAALCPFPANYNVAPLAETLSIFFVAVALDAAAAGLNASDDASVPQVRVPALDANLGSQARHIWLAWICCGLAVSCGILLRPDGGILLIAIGLYLLWRMWTRPPERARVFWAGTLVLAITVAPLVPWTIRNWRDFHRFQPLVPQSASDPDEFVPDGFDRWTKTWAADYVSTEEVYWQVPGDKIDLTLLPRRAFDSANERATTQTLFSDYAKILVVNPELNARLTELANDRIRRDPLRYYVWLPTLRIADMWLRPRTEMLPLNSRWWEYSDDTRDCVIATLWGLLNLLFIFAAVMGIVRGPRPRYLGMMLLFVLLRSAFLGTLANPEPRYTLECFPVVLLLGASWISGWKRWVDAS